MRSNSFVSDGTIPTGWYAKAPPAGRGGRTAARILAGAEPLFLAKTYAEVSMDQIAEKSEVTKGALYHHFSSKKELYLAMMTADLEAKKALFESAVEGGANCRDRLTRLTRAYFELPAEKSDLIRLVRRDKDAFERADRRRLIRAYQACLPELVEQVLRDGIGRGEIAAADARLLAWQFVALVETTLGEYAKSVIGGLEERLGLVIGLFFEGAAAHPREEAVP